MGVLNMRLRQPLPHARLLVAASILVLAGCGGGVDGKPAVMVVPAPGAPSSGPGSVQVLTIASGALAPADAATFTPLASLGSATVSFRLVMAGGGVQGARRGSLGAQNDEPARVASVASFYLATCELTQGQWTALATRAGLAGVDQLTPWQTAAPSGAVGSTASVADRAASALSYDLVAAALAGYNAAGGPGQPTLRLPTATEWEHACRAGTDGSFPWGDNQSLATVAAFAVVRETRTAAGVDTVAGVGGTARQPNAFGFYDMAGNVWEWVASTGPDATLRGGSWCDNLLSARCANRQTMDRSIPYGSAGVRLVLVPP
jgi:sulfatase modifying factor 1